MAFDVSTEQAGDIAVITLSGELDANAAGSFRSAVEEAAAAGPKRVVLVMDKLQFIASAGLQVSSCQKMGTSIDLFVVGNDAVLETIK